MLITPTLLTRFLIASRNYYTTIILFIGGIYLTLMNAEPGY